MRMDNAYRLTLQIFDAGHWQDAMTLEFSEPDKGFASPCRFGYESTYLVDHLDEMDTLFAKAVSVRVPLNWSQETPKHAAAFLQ